MRNLKQKSGVLFLLVFTLFIFCICNINAITFSKAQYEMPGASSFNYNYGTEVNIYTKFDDNMCDKGTDFALQIAPLGCSPAVVTSDLLEEQDVPVFCQIAATKINPLIQVEAIDSMTFAGEYPKEVSGIGFHPANSFASTYTGGSQLLNSPILQNIGYAVIVLKKQNNESSMPSVVSGNVTANIKYNIQNSYGIGSPTFFLPEISDDAIWQQSYEEYAFWNGKGYLRVEGLDDKSAVVGVYADASRRLNTVSLNRGESSNIIYLPGYQCVAGAKLKLEDITIPGLTAKLMISDEGVIEVQKGSQFLEGRCTVNDIISNGLVKEVIGYCKEDSGKNNAFDFLVSPKVSVNVNGKLLNDLEVGDIIYPDFGANRDKNIFLGYIGKNKDGAFIMPVVSTARTKAEFLASSEFRTSINFLKIDQYKTGAWTIDSLKHIVNPIVQLGGQVAGGVIKGGYPLGTYYEGNKKKTFDAVFDITKSVVGSIVEPMSSVPDIQFVSYSGIVDRDISPEFKIKFNAAIQDYRRIITDLSNEKNSVSDTETLGERAYKDAIILSSSTEQFETNSKFCEEFKEKYPMKYLDIKINCIEGDVASSSGVTSGSYLVNGRAKGVSLIDVYEPNPQDYSVDVIVHGGNKIDGQIVTLNRNVPLYITDKEYIMLNQISGDYAVLDVSSIEKGVLYSAVTGDAISLREGQKQSVGKNSYVIELQKITAKKVAKVSIEPNIRQRGSSGNFSFSVAIEKRAIQLSPEKTKSRIKETEAQIKQLDGLSNALTNVVKGMKAACLGTGLLVTAKNFISNVDGSSIARKQVMRDSNGWTDYCKTQVGVEADKPFKSMDECYLKNSDAIQEDMNVLQGVMSASEFTKEDMTDEKLGNLLTRLKSVAGVVEESNPGFGNGLNNADIKSAFTSNGYSKNIITLTQARDLSTYTSVLEKGTSSSGQINKIASSKINTIIYDIRLNAEGLSQTTSLETTYGMEVAHIASKNTREVIYRGKYFSEVRSKYDTPSPAILDTEPVQTVLDDVDSLSYLVVLKSDFSTVDRTYSISGRTLTLDNTNRNRQNEITNNPLNIRFRKLTRDSYKNPIKDYKTLKLVKFFETDPYKGRPAILPFDVVNGWYVYARQNLAIGGSIRAYDDSGSPVSYQLCNVGPNGLIEAENGYGDDICSGFALGIGAQLSTFPGLDLGETQQLLSKANQAIAQAEKLYKPGVARININGVDSPLLVGDSAVDIPAIQCQDVMSPEDCLLIYNVCDPVICPSSRCDFGGRYPVSDVVQSGLIGSILLCLPNYQEGIVVPVCLSGIQASLDGYVSLLKNYKSCLQESLDTGKTTGVCDEINSIYLCEFAWKQVMPLSKLIVSQGIQLLSGENPHGGGEYLNVQSAYSNAQDSLNFMSTYYGIASVDAFKVRAWNVVQESVCKQSISVVYPSMTKLFDNLVEPASPDQYSGWFTETPFTTATVPATSQYKVFYHIYSGKEKGAYFSVYLRNPAATGVYNVNPEITVSSGYINTNDFASETKDFTAPAGYQEMCINVNGKEECGFGKVSTDFAVDYADTLYRTEQASMTDIQTQDDCVSGVASAYSMLNPNLEAGADNVLNPELYKNGITRVCSTDNPGKGTDSAWNTEKARWKQVGTCDSGANKIKCWLDAQSVTANIKDKVLANSTLEDVQNAWKKVFEGNGALTQVDFENVKKFYNDNLQNNPQLVIDKITDDFLSRVMFSNYKANLIYFRAVSYARISVNLFTKFEAEHPTIITGTGGTGTGTGGTGSWSTTEVVVSNFENAFQSAGTVFELDPGSLISTGKYKFKYESNVWKGTDVKNPNVWVSVSELAKTYTSNDVYLALSTKNFESGLSYMTNIVKSTDNKWLKYDGSLTTTGIVYRADGVFDIDESILNMKVYLRLNETAWQVSLDDNVWNNIEGIDYSLLEKNGLSVGANVRLFAENLKNKNFIQGSVMIFGLNLPNWETILQQGATSTGGTGTVPVTSDAARNKILQTVVNLIGTDASRAAVAPTKDPNIVSCWDAVIYIYDKVGMLYPCTYSDISGKKYALSIGQEITVEAPVSGQAYPTFACSIAFEGANTKCKNSALSEQDKLNLLQPGDIIHYAVSPITPHNSIFIEWVNRENNLARLVDWRGFENCNAGVKQCFRYYTEDISDNAHPVYVINSPASEIGGTSGTSTTSTTSTSTQNIPDCGGCGSYCSQDECTKINKNCKWTSGTLGTSFFAKCVYVASISGITSSTSSSSTSTGEVVNLDRTRISNAITYASTHTISAPTGNTNDARKCKCGSECESYVDYILEASQTYGITDPLYLLALMTGETNCEGKLTCGPDCSALKGCTLTAAECCPNVAAGDWTCGIMQIKRSAFNTGEDPLDKKTNILAAARLLKAKYNSVKSLSGPTVNGPCSPPNYESNWEKALHAYNGFSCSNFDYFNRIKNIYNTLEENSDSSGV